MAKKLADGVKGIDDLLAAVGPELVSSLLANAKVITKAKPRTKACVTEISSRNGWRSELIVNKEGLPKPVLANALLVLRNAPEWNGVLGYDEFAACTVARKPPPFRDTQPTAWTAQEDLMTTDWLQRWGLLVSLETAGQALEAVSRDASFHPVRDYLESLTWDGVPRLEGWLAQYLGVDDNTFSRAVASKWMVSAIARVYRPGIKADCCLILEGAQGIKKSTALRVLAGDWYTDEIADLGSKDSAMQARGVWIIELAELDSLSRSDVGRVKAFISRGTDRFRPPYAKRLILSPRQCVFAGTVNQTAYLRDETGGRRFWPVSCGLINIEALMRDRDQLWAEARWRFEAGELWWMHTQELNDAAEQEQTARYQGDPWDTLVKEYVENRWLRHAPVTVPDILGNCLNIPKERWRQADSNRVARCLRADGWVRRQVRDADSEGRPMREWRYCKGKDVCRDDQSDPNWRYR